MRELITIFIIAGSIFITQNVFAQSVSANENQSKPTATVTFNTPRTVSPMVIKVNELTGGDDVMTEKVIAEIYNRKDIKVDNVLSDEDFERLSDEDKKDCISEAEVLIIIESLEQ
ncbi:MAG: hypothetical protein C0596_14730 [Marinilabiliales bacterium]|nr:MAG: hypothetical protein C0596_14730 [Marinilabiliales bacterium]